jgi:hypothetical protein
MDLASMLYCRLAVRRGGHGFSMNRMSYADRLAGAIRGRASRPVFES